MVTVSTTSCVSARSGADSQTKLMQVTRPAPPSRMSAARRWNLALYAAPKAQAIADRPDQRECKVERRCAARPQIQALVRIAAPEPTNSAAHTSSCNCGWSRRVPRRLSQPSGQPPRDGDEHPLENPLALEMAQQRADPSPTSR